MIADLELLSYRRIVAELYSQVRRRGPSEDTWSWWVEQRHELFATHPASPYVMAGRPFDGLRYHPYDPAFHLGEVVVRPAPPVELVIGHSGRGTTSARRFATVGLDVAGNRHEVSVYWLEVYGGGVFLPLRDATNGVSTYGGGRYLLDTVKSADLGGSADRLVLDLNFAYHPSCVHDASWSCPLAPVDERLPVAITAGERLGEAAGDPLAETG
jgi:uncharacterized protein